MKPTHSLYLSYDGLTDPLGQSQILPYILGLDSLGIHFHIISFEKKSNFKKAHQIIEGQIYNRNISWHALTYRKNPPVLSTILDVIRLRKKVHRLIKSEKINIIHCRSYITALIGLWAKREYNIPFIFDMRGFWADERVEGGLWSLKNPVYRTIYNYFKKKEKQFFQESDQIISLTENAKTEIISWKLQNVSEEKIIVIPCCSDIDIFNPGGIAPAKKEKLKGELDIKSNQFTLMYLGSLGTWYMLDHMLLFFEKLVEKKQDAVFLFLTKEKELLNQKLESGGWRIENEATGNRQFFKKNISRIICTSVSREEVPKYLAISDATISFIKPSFSKKASSATKIGESLSMNKPVVVNTGWGDISLYLDKTNCLIPLDASDNDSLKNGVQNLLDSVKSVKNEPRDFTSKFLSLEVGKNAYLKVYQKVLGK